MDEHMGEHDGIVEQQEVELPKIEDHFQIIHSAIL